MPSTPTTKSQVQAYQFVLRRMQSALVRRDAVMLHDPMRTHSRATIVGVVLGALGMLAFVIVGFFSPKPKPPTDGGIIVAKESGAVYLMSANPQALTPVFNLASARLLHMAQAQQGAQGGQAPAAGSAPPETRVIPEEQLKDIPRLQKMGIPDAPEMLPGKDKQISPNWAVCDEIQLDSSLNEGAAIQRAQRETTVLGGVPDLGPELPREQGLLVTADNDESYLVYRLADNPNRSSSETVKAKVDLGNNAVRSALELSGNPERTVSTGLLDTIREVPDLEAPDVAGKGEPNSLGLNQLNVGEVFSVSRAGETVPDFWLIHKDGIQKVSASVADLVRFDRQRGAEVPKISPDRLAEIRTIEPPEGADIDEYPPMIPEILSPLQAPVTCLGWKVVGEGENRDGETTLHVGPSMPGPKNGPDGKLRSLDIGQANPDGSKVDKFYMQPGLGAVVRSATGKDTFDSGLIYVISDRGLRYGIPDVATAQGLGLTDMQPAHDPIVRLLPTGSELTTSEVLRTYDRVPIDPNAGTFPTEQPQAANPGGG
ncbi:type VII secretion protein EccB [Amycolatopsis antarctica]|uniref:Type VII secretion protein EccB n=1 Tax=Amycolatopsis antarctica TaxID=1854586 RepID=A0A263DA88_9PSEU|nr:type VII secretion protein EccB [Amycolatopsis antarctica]OZM74908.1 type VII secretion protein EccB [Amycolatopsis antarctica]